jgi:hypothetical protein
LGTAAAVLLACLLLRSFLPLSQLIRQLERSEQKVLVNHLVDYFVAVGVDPEDVQAGVQLLEQPEQGDKIKCIILNYFNHSY